MISVPKLELHRILLILLNLSLLAVMILVWRTGQQRVSEPRRIAAHEIAFPDLAAVRVTAVPTVDVAAIRDNAVFHQTRSYYLPPQPSQSIPGPEYDFAGTLSLPAGKRVAFVKRKSDQASRTLHIGDDLDGWRVDSIDALQVGLTHAEQRVELKPAGQSPSLGLARGAAVSVISQSTPHILGAQTLRSSVSASPVQSGTTQSYGRPKL